jgi:hypothetical protein
MVIQDLPTPALSIAHEPSVALSAVSRRKRGRPLEMQPHEVLARIREMALRNALFRVHLDAPSLYARARRQFGTWASALVAAGVDHAAAIKAARRRAVEHRRGRLTRLAR